MELRSVLEKMCTLAARDPQTSKSGHCDRKRELTTAYHTYRKPVLVVKLFITHGAKLMKADWLKQRAFFFLITRTLFG